MPVGPSASSAATKLGTAYDRTGDLVFPNEGGAPLQLRNVTRRHFKAAVRAAGLPPSLRVYDLRHTHATALLAQGVHVKVAAERLGHATTRLTLARWLQGVCRLLGVVVDGGLGPTLLLGPIHISALVFELATGALAFVAFSRARTVRLSAA